MSDFDKRVQVNKIIESQLPEFITSDFPKAVEFFKQYYISQEFQGGNSDLAENLDQYLKLDNLVPEVVVGKTTLSSAITSSDTTISVSSTKGFPSEYGLLKIDDEIITYTGITTNTFTGCIRGFSGVTGYSVGISSYVNSVNKQNLIFKETESASHNSSSVVTNLSVIFLQEFYKKLKYTFAPGLENTDFVSDLDVGNFLKNIRSFYQSKGIEESIRILFKVLYGEDAKVLDLEEYLIKPSSAKFIRKEEIVCQLISGDDPTKLVGQTIFKSTDSSTNASVSEVEVFTRNNLSYYKISLFVGYSDKDLIEGTFTIPGKTRVLETVSVGSSIISVDSTIGFGQTGTLISGNNTINYTSKSINQFFGCSGVNTQISLADNIRSDEVIYGYEDGDRSKKVTLRITGVLSKFVAESDISLSDENEIITIKNVGEVVENPTTNKTYKEIFANSWIYNTSSRYQVGSISGSTFTLKSLIDKSSLKVGDTVDILVRNSSTIVLSGATVATVNVSLNQVILSNTFGFTYNPNLEYDIRRNLKKSSSLGVSLLDGNNVYLSETLNTYFDRDQYGYAASNSLPSYTITENIIESSLQNGLLDKTVNLFNEDTQLYSAISFADPVSFIDGDVIVYTASNQVLPGLVSGEFYYVKLLNTNKIRLYSSKALLSMPDTGTDENGDPLQPPYVEFDQVATSGTHTFTLKRHSGRVLAPNKILRKFPLSQNLFTKTIEKRGIGPVGILIDGVQIISPDSNDRVYYGPLESFEVLNGGRDYDVINPPRITISTGAGTTALVEPIISGIVSAVYVDPQDFDIEKVISLSLSGGNGSGCILEPIMGERFRELEFDSRDILFGGGLDITTETITFTKPHNLKDGETIIYNQNGNDPIGIGTFGSVTNAVTGTLVSGDQYIAKFVNTSTIKLYNTFSDYSANNYAGINTIGFSTNTTASGIHKFRTVSKNTLRSIKVLNGGSGYQHRKLRVNPTGISTQFDSINYTNHGFNTGELVQYSTTGTSITGLSTTNQYYILKIDNDSFRLTNAGIGGTITADYDRKKYVNLQSVGSGYHIFKYPDIEVNVNVSYGTSIGGSFTFTPLVTGKIIGAYLYENGTGYGSEILNLHKKPIITLKNGKEAQLNPIIINGRIQDVQVLGSGYEYTSIPSLVVKGSGTGAILRPVIENEKLVDVVVINTGIGYSATDTDIEVKARGSGAIFDVRVRELILNDQSRFGQNSLLGIGSYLSYGLFGYSEDLGQVYGDNGTSHSPIIGWAFDGNPIYGPYGYEDSTDNQSRVKLLSPGYSLNTTNLIDRPSSFSPGFFIDDYQYNASGDLDEYNGRFCKTPEFPNGIYAYFAGVSTSLVTGKLEPEYPYFIGNQYRSELIAENLILDQSFDFNSSTLSRNTYPYKVGELYADNDFILESNEFINQSSIIESVTKGSVSSIEVVDGGVGYKVGDYTRFDETDTNGTGLSGQVSEIKGKNILRLQTQLQRFENAVFVWNSDQTVSAYHTPYFGLYDQDNVSISGLSTSILNLSGTFTVGIASDIIGLGKSMSVNSNPDGVIEDIYVSTIPNSVSIGSTLLVGGEYVKVLNKYPVGSVLRVKRFGVGVAHTFNTPVYVLSNKINIQTKTNQFESKVNDKVFFNGHQSVGVGTTSGAGITTSYIIGETSKDIYIPTQSIYLPDHPFKTGQQVTISRSPLAGVDAFLVSNTATSSQFNLPDLVTNSSTAYVINKSKDYIGLTTQVGLTTMTNGLYFRSNGSNNSEYLLESNYDQVTGDIDRIITTVRTEERHGLTNGDSIRLVVKPNVVVGLGTTSALSLYFDADNQKILVNKVGFDSSQINTINNTITIPSHGYKDGDKVYYNNTDEIASGLSTGSYFVLKVDSSTFKLTETYYDTQVKNPETVNITGVGGSEHFVSLVNPQINVVKNSRLTFNLSDPSLYQHRLKIFCDKDFTNEFVSIGNSNNFNVIGVGTVGLGTNGSSSLSITYSDSLPAKLYYTLEKSGYISTADTEVINYSQISFVDSAYNGTHTVSGVGTTTFQISPKILPELLVYAEDQCDVLEYSTSSTSVSGPIKTVKVLSKGFNYKKTPKFLNVVSENGINANLVAISTSIGRIKDIRIVDIGYEYSSDKTLRPEAFVQPIIRVDDVDTVASIGIESGGKNYITPPDLILYNPSNNQVIDTTSFIANVPNSTISSVDVLTPLYGIESTEHRLIAVNNSNGVGITSIFGGPSGIVTCTLATPVLGFTTYPFAVGDRIFVENVELIDSTSGTGYNSADYQYRFFTVSAFTSSIPNRVEFNLVTDDGVGLTTNPGIAKTFQSGYATIVNASNYPSFEVIQQRALFALGEQLYVDSGNGFEEKDLFVSSSREDYIKVTGTYGYSLENNQILKGKLSGVIARVSEIVENKAKFEVDYSSLRNYGWIDDTGKLDEDYQVIPDNDYYQNLSYSIKSGITFDEFIDPVNSILHPAGLKNFADVGITSSVDATVSYAATTNSVVILDVIDEKRVDTINNFDLALDYDTRENKSKYLKVKNRKLTDYIKCLTNRVLTHDDISNRFSSKGDQDLFTEVEEINDNFVRYLIQVVDPDTLDCQITDLVILSSTFDIFTFERFNVYSNINLGSFDAEIDSFERKTLIFTPTEQFDKDHDIKILKNVFGTDLAGIGTQNIGSVKLISSNVGVASTSPTVGIVTQTIAEYSASSFNSLFANIQIQNTITKELNYLDVVLDFDGTNTYLGEYYFDSEEASYSSSRIGILTSTYDSVSGKVSLKIENTSTNPFLVRSNVVGLITTTSGIGTYRFAVPGQPAGAERSARLESTVDVGISTRTVATLSLNDDTSVKSLVRVSCGQTSALHQVILLQDTSNIFVNQGPFLPRNNVSGMGTFGGESDGTNVYLKFYPDSEFSTSNITVQAYNEVLYTINDFENEPQDLTYGPINQSIFLSAYDGLNGTRANKVDFDLKYEGTPVYVKTFNPSDSTQLDPVTGIFSIPNHFFNTAEELIYTPTSTFIGVGQSSVGIGSTANYLGVVTSRLPSRVYPIVINANQFRLSTRKDYANAGIYVTFTDAGLGNAHKLEMTKKLEKTVISLDGIVQQPITYTPISHTLQNNIGGQINSGIATFSLSGISSIQPRDILKIDDEYMKVVAVGFGSTSIGPIAPISETSLSTPYPLVVVKRASIGSTGVAHTDTSMVRVYRGAFNIVGSKVYFLDPPKGNTRQRRSDTNLPYVRAKFSGRTFLRQNYDTNMLFDDISNEFTGIGKTYTLTVQGLNTTGLSAGNGILFINGVFQTPTTSNNAGNNYELTSSAGISSVIFTGITSTDGTYIKSDFDINQNQLPRGGLIVSLGSTPGLGYAPLVGANVKANLSSGSIVSITGISHTGPSQSITTASYNNTTGIIDITTPTNHNFVGGDKVKLVGLAFTCPSGAGIVSYFPSTGLDRSYGISGIISARTFSVNVGTSTLPHTYIGMGTIFPWYDLNYGSGYRGTVSIAVTDSSHTGTAANISAVVGAGGTLSFVVNSGGSGYVNPYIQIPDPVYENLEIVGVSRLGIGTTTNTGRNLLLNVNVGPSNTTGIGSTYFQVSSFKISRPGYGFQIGDEFKAVGLVTAAGLAAPISEFKLTVTEIFYDYFSAWQFGELDNIDSIRFLQDGTRTRFPLYYNGELLSFEIDPADSLSSSIDLNAVLVIFINGVLQKPGEAYNFEGGTSFDFTEPPKRNDDVDIFFYIGTDGVDVQQINVDETIKIGDDVRVYKNPNFPITETQEQNRIIEDITGSDILETNIYVGRGISETTYKPFEWNKQKVDKFIKGSIVYKDRLSIEPRIYPTSKIIGDITPSSTEIFVDDAQFFQYEDNEYNLTITNNLDALIVSGTDPVSAAFTATVSAAGTIQSVTITNPGLGYTGNIPIKFANPKTIGIGIGTTATATALVSSGIVTFVQITNPGFGYTQLTPPQVLVEIPQPNTEMIDEIANIQGFSGIITGITTSAGVGGHPLGLKFFFRADAADANDLQVGYPICIVDTTVGNGVTSVNGSNASVVGIGTTFLDNIYIVGSKTNLGPDAEIVCNVHTNSSIVGIATTGSTTMPLGRFSWGRIYNFSARTNPISIGVTGLTVDSGLSTFPSIQRRGYGFRGGSIRVKINADADENQTYSY